MSLDITIGIATRNRWDDLKITLSKIEEYGWRKVPLLIFDDFSDTPCPFDVKEILPCAELKRFCESKGYIIRRNQMAESISTRYYLSLDDDSYPSQGSIGEVLDLISSSDNIFCVAFPIYNPISGKQQVASLKEYPYQVRSFVGCAHLLDIIKFKNLNGYRAELVHQGEEMDIAVRAYKKGWRCIHFPALSIDHCMSLSGRNWDRMDYYGARNNILWNDWYLPKPIKIPIQIKNIISRIILSLKVKRVGQIVGMRDGFSSIKKLRKFRDELTIKSYLSWRRLPNS